MDRKKRSKKNTKKIILLSLAGVVAVVAVFVGIFYNRIVCTPEILFPSTKAMTYDSVQVVTPMPTLELLTSDELPTPTPGATPNSYEQLKEIAEHSIMKDIVNILLIGVDYSEERDTWSGKHDFHSDVMIVVAVNFQENTVDLISLPRDTYAQVPGVKGIYKLNAAIDCGGGYPEGLPKVAEAASWMLGDIPVDYYYAITMPVAKELVDAIDGVDYDIDASFELMGRAYEKGMQHMDGQAVLDYLRVRKNIQQSGDLNRINRQKNMLIAIFRKMKSTDLLVKVPQFIGAFEGKVVTNTTLEQTAALAVFGYGLPEENIRMHTMEGSMHDIFNWNFCVTNQSKRVQLIKDVYGVDVPKYEQFGLDYCQRQWAQMRSSKYFQTAQRVIEAAENYASSSNIPMAPVENFEMLTEQSSSEPSNENHEDLKGEGSEAMSANDADDVTSLLGTANSALSAARSALSDSGSSANAAMATLVDDVTALASAVGYGSLDWRVSYENEIQVDFR